MSQQQSSNEQTGCSGGLARILVAVFLLLTVLVCACYGAIFLNPHLPFNPWPPLVGQAAAPPPSAQVQATPAVPTFTPPPTFPPTWTPTLTPVPTETSPPRPTSTPRPPTLTPVPTVAPTSTPRPMQFTLREAPIFVRQTLYPGAGNWWTGVAGEVSTLAGEAVTDVVIRIWDNKGHAWETQPGGAANYAQSYGTTYGGGGSYAWWEQVLDGSCQQEITVNVQVLSNGKPASSQVTTKTTGNCQTNLVLVHFVKNW